MMRIDLSNKMKNCVLSKDIYSNKGKLLLTQGYKLEDNDIYLLIDQKISEIYIEKNLEKIERVLTDLYSEGLSTVKTLFNDAANNKKIELDNAINAVNEIKDYITVHKELLFQFIMKSNIDDYTIQHSLNVSILSSILAELHRLSPEEIIRISNAGLLHDIGKSLIPEDILLKPDKLTYIEFNIIKDHAELGHDILIKNGIKDAFILTATKMHHERLNGAGYPEGLKGNEISIAAQIVAVTDVFDAITSKRVYKDPQSIIKACQELKNSAFNKELNAELVFEFLERISYSFIGKRVLLNNNMTGKIIKLDKFDFERPLIEVEGKFINLIKSPELEIINFID